MAKTAMALETLQNDVTPQETRDFSVSVDEQIRERAHQIWLQRDGHPGSAIADWLEAEAEVLGTPAL
jgi:hypothetical protein